jgi:hypothetical protein
MAQRCSPHGSQEAERQEGSRDKIHPSKALPSNVPFSYEFMKGLIH